MIVTKAGRSRSYRTAEEVSTLLEREIGSLSASERIALETVLAELDGQAAPTEKLLINWLGEAEYKRTPVDMETFCRDKYYLGNTCDNIYQKLLDDLTELFAGGYHEAIWTGSIGYGKTFAASIGICRILYELSCMASPHESFGLAKDSNISIVNLSVNETLATKVVFENISTKIRASPYFQENFRFKPTKKELRFPGNVWVAARASTDTSALGLNVVSAIMDECLCAGSKLLLASGREVAVEFLESGGEASVETFDFTRNVAVPSQAFIQRSTDQECFELTLSDGVRRRWSGTHPVAVLRGDSLVFNVLSDIVEGDVVVTYAPVDKRTQGTTRGENEGSLGGGEVCGQKCQLDRRNAGGRLRENDSTESGWEAPRPSCDGRRSKSILRSSAVGEEQRGGSEGEHGENSFYRDTSVDVGSPTRKSSPHRGVQEGASREKQNQGVQPHGGIEAEDQRVQRVEDPEGGLALSRVCSDLEGRSRRFSQYVGSSCDGDFGEQGGRSFFCIREAISSLYLEGESKENLTRLQDRACGWGRSCCGGEASGIYLQQERTGKVDSRSEVLRGARLGIRGLGRTLSLARVVSKRPLGVLPTYAVDVPGHEVFIADSVLVHNTNFMAKSSKQKASNARWQHYDRAETLYAAIKRRMKSRFERNGRLPGCIFVVSSKRTKDDFTARRVIEAENDPDVFVRDYALWDVKPEEYYSAERFWVLCGNESTPSRVLVDDEVEAIKKNATEGLVVIDVPTDFRNDFERDLEGAIRDIAGVATVSVSPFIHRREKIDEAVDRSRTHPFSTLLFDPSRGGHFKWDQMVASTAQRGIGGAHFAMMRPKINPNALRHVHIDPSLTSDATGFVMAHIAGWKDVERRGEGEAVYTEAAPVYIVDVVLRIVPPLGDELILGDVRKLVYAMGSHGYSIACISMDSYQSADSLQKLKEKGYNSELLSVDKTMEPYENLKLALYEGRVFFYDYPPMLDELRKLEHNRERNKVDHPVGGSKDITDALAGCLHTLSMHRTAKPLPVLKSTAYAGDAWMEEQRQAAAAGDHGAGVSHSLGDMLPPFLLGSGGNDGW